MSDLKFTSVEDTPEMVQAKVSNKLATDVSVSFVKEATMKGWTCKKQGCLLVLSLYRGCTGRKEKTRSTATR